MLNYERENSQSHNNWDFFPALLKKNLSSEKTHTHTHTDSHVIVKMKNTKAKENLLKTDKRKNRLFTNNSS